MSDSWNAYLETPPAMFSETFSGPIPCQSSLGDVVPIGPCDETRVPTQMESLDTFTPISYPDEPDFDTGASFGEIENRVVILSNIPPSEDLEELKHYLAQFGAVEAFDDTNFSRGILAVHYFDICAAQCLRRSDVRLNGKVVMMTYGPLEEVKNRKKPPNNGTIVIFHLPEDTTDEELRQLFVRFGRIKQIRSSPFKQSQKFIEFYDKRHAQAALTAMNGTYVRSSKINIEFSLPGGFRRSAQSHAPSVPMIERVRH